MGIRTCAIALCLAGCSTESGSRMAAMYRAWYDMRCAANELHVIAAIETTYTIRGCGYEGRYTCWSDRWSNYTCVRQDPHGECGPAWCASPPDV